MTTFAVAMVKDEFDIIGSVLARLANQVDRIIVADNASSDGTADLLSDLARDLPLTVLHEPDPAYYQSARMTGLAARAASAGATWIVPFDADEVWSSPFGRLGDVLEDWPYPLAGAALYDYVASGLDDQAEQDPVVRMMWRRRDPVGLPKVAARTSLPVTIHQGNHGAGYGEMPLTLDRPLVVRHFPIRSPEQMIRKARNGGAAYAATDLPEDIGAHWRGWNRLSDDDLLGVFRRYYFSEAPDRDPGMVRDRVAALCPALQ